MTGENIKGTFWEQMNLVLLLSAVLLQSLHAGSTPHVPARVRTRAQLSLARVLGSDMMTSLLRKGSRVPFGSGPETLGARFCRSAKVQEQHRQY